MGLDFSHGEARWGYGSFRIFRKRLSEEIGFHEYDSIGTTVDPRYEPFMNDGIHPLLAHSDCDGELTVEECKRVAPRLRELVKDWPDNDFHKTQALKLAEGMEDAIAAGESLQFV